MMLPQAAHELAICWDSVDARNLTVDDYLARQRIMGLMIVKDGVIQVERYQYDRRPGDRFLSNSMVKSITSLGSGIALREGKIRSLDDRADVYAPGPAGTLYGATTIRNLLHRQIIPLDYLHDATDWHRVPEAFRPHNAAPYYRYGFQFWLFPGEQPRFAMLGVYGQMIFVDPQRKLVMVQTAASASAKVGGSGKEAGEFWRGVERGCGGGS